MPRKPDPELPDADTPEALDAWISKARPASELLTGLFGQSAAKEVLAPKRGRPALPEPKEQVNIRLMRISWAHSGRPALVGKPA